MITTGGPRNSAPGTLNPSSFDAVATYHKPDALQVKRNGRYEPISHDTLARARAPHRARPRGARRARRRSRRDSLGESPRVGDRRLRLPHARRRPTCRSIRICRAIRSRYILRDSGAVAIFVSNAGAGGEDRADSRRVSARCGTSSRSPTRARGRRPHAGGARGAGAPVDNEARRARVSRRARSPCARTIWRRSSTRRARRASRRA